MSCKQSRVFQSCPNCTPTFTLSQVFPSPNLTVWCQIASHSSTFFYTRWLTWNNNVLSPLLNKRFWICNRLLFVVFISKQSKWKCCDFHKKKRFYHLTNLIVTSYKLYHQTLLRRSRFWMTCRRIKIPIYSRNCRCRCTRWCCCFFCWFTLLWICSRTILNVLAMHGMINLQKFTLNLSFAWAWVRAPCKSIALPHRSWFEDIQEPP